MYIIRLMGLADGRKTRYDGLYLKSSDVDANDGRGSIEAVHDPRDAMRFKSLDQVFDYWRRQSNTVPFRPDGKPNRPLTAFNISPERMLHDKFNK